MECPHYSRYPCFSGVHSVGFHCSVLVENINWWYHSFLLHVNIQSIVVYKFLCLLVAHYSFAFLTCLVFIQMVQACIV